MASTDRHFDDSKILLELQKRFGLSLPSNADDIQIEVEYQAPIQNGAVGAYFDVSFRIRTNSTVADEILREQMI